MLNFKSIEVFFEPPNETRRFQSLDVGMIASVETAHRNCVLRRFLDSTGANAKSIYNVDILRAMRCVQSCWEGMAASAIKNFWEHGFQTLKEK